MGIRQRLWIRGRVVRTRILVSQRAADNGSNGRARVASCNTVDPKCRSAAAHTGEPQYQRQHRRKKPVVNTLEGTLKLETYNRFVAE